MRYNELLDNLKKRGFHPYFDSSREEGIKIIREIIPKRSSIGFGGSVTVDELDLVDIMKDEYKLLHRSLYDKSKHEDLYWEMARADWYITSTNAIAQTGELINIDGRANRVAAMLYGPKNILVVCGVNKIVKDINEGIDRVRNVAAPLNTKRLAKNTPCAITGKCGNCLSPDTICKATVIHHHPTTGKNFYIVLIDEKLGY
jgi:L-lactate utilization protein LutB